MLTPERIEELARPHITTVGSHWEHDDAIPDNGRIEDFARAIEAEVRKDYDALIRQMLEALESCYTDDNGEEIEDGFDEKKVEAAKYAARARLIDSDLSKLTERGAKAWAGVDPQKLREGGAL